MQTSSKPPRLNYNVPRSLVNDVKAIAQSKDMEPSWWLTKVIERALAEARHKSST